MRWRTHNKPTGIFRVFLFQLLILMSLGSVSCKSRYRQPEQEAKSPYPDQESIFRANQAILKQNDQSIRDQATIKGWKLSETGSGVFYQIFTASKKHPDQRIAPGDWVSLSYRLNLLDGTECYSSKGKGLKQFIVNKSEAEPGLHEAIQFLRPGDSALIIIPPHRAFGLTGDGNRIPPRAILVYEIHVDSVARPGSH